MAVRPVHVRTREIDDMKPKKTYKLPHARACGENLLCQSPKVWVLLEIYNPETEVTAGTGPSKVQVFLL